MEDPSIKAVKFKAIDILKDTFENTNRWLIFAESKNGALLGINGLFLFKILDYLNKVETTTLNVNMIWILLIVFICSTVVILKTFFPNCSAYSDKSASLCKKDNDDFGILIFYQDISKYESSKLYLRDIYKNYLEIDIDLKNLKAYELDYAKEIMINSRITSYKYKYFKIALSLNILGIFLLVLFHVTC